MINGTLNISPNIPAQVIVNITGGGFNSPETRSTAITLQAGSQSFSQNLSLAQLQASGGTMTLTFNFSFSEKDIGRQTVSVTVDPGNALNEKVFSNNTVSTQVTVGGYKLVAFLNGSSGPIPDSGGDMTLVPSVKACGSLPAAEEGDTDVEIRCVKTNDPTFAAVPDCRFTLDLSDGPDLGGHNHNLGDETRPFVLDPDSPSFPVGELRFVDLDGKNLTYSPPEVAGDVFFEVAGVDPGGNAISGPSFMFHIKDTSLGEMGTLNSLGVGLGPTGINPGILVEAKSHPSDGIFGTQVMRTAVSNMVAQYYRLGDANGFPSLDPLRSEAGTMQEGGLFDANWNGAIMPTFLTPWSSPHCGHRDGITIDLSINQLDVNERDWLQQAASLSGFRFTSPGERPQDTSANHWHAQLRTFKEE